MCTAEIIVVLVVGMVLLIVEFLLAVFFDGDLGSEVFSGRCLFSGQEGTLIAAVRGRSDENFIQTLLNVLQIILNDRAFDRFHRHFASLLVMRKILSGDENGPGQVRSFDVRRRMGEVRLTGMFNVQWTREHRTSLSRTLGKILKGIVMTHVDSGFDILMGR